MKVRTQRRYKPVPFFGYGLDEHWRVGRISQGKPQLTHGCIQSILEADIGAIAPNALLEFLARDDVIGSLK
jgi:hypothetical protein